MTSTSTTTTATKSKVNQQKWQPIPAGKPVEICGEKFQVLDDMKGNEKNDVAEKNIDSNSSTQHHQQEMMKSEEEAAKNVVLGKPQQTVTPFVPASTVDNGDTKLKMNSRETTNNKMGNEPEEMKEEVEADDDEDEPIFQLTERQELALQDSVAKMLQGGKGLLAADDTIDSLGTRLEAAGMENNAENRRRYRQLLFTTPNLGKHISAVILHDESTRQCTDKGERFVDLLRRQGIAAGVKVDADPVPLIPGKNASAQIETLTQGLDNLASRLAEYRSGGCVFAKWRCAYRISERSPSQMALEQNAMMVARYAMLCQSQGLVPIVEPDVSAQGSHSIEQCQKVTQSVLAYIFKALADHAIFLEGTVIKMNMVTAGFNSSSQASPEMVAEQTLLTLRRTVPVAVPGIAFLSGGHSELLATQYLSAINKLAGPTGSEQKPWLLTFCFGRALQANVLELWCGNSENVGAAQKQFLHRARANAEAEQGRYEGEKAVAEALSAVNFGNVGGPTRYY